MTDNRGTSPIVRCPRSTCGKFLKIEPGQRRVECPECKAKFFMTDEMIEIARRTPWPS